MNIILYLLLGFVMIVGSLVLIAVLNDSHEKRKKKAKENKRH